MGIILYPKTGDIRIPSTYKGKNWEANLFHEPHDVRVRAIKWNKEGNITHHLEFGYPFAYGTGVAEKPQKFWSLFRRKIKKNNYWIKI